MKCFIIMPFGNRDEYSGGRDEADHIFQDIIKPGLIRALGDTAEIHCEMASNDSGAITTSIIRRIYESDICIVDITGSNANVFFELGIRYALRRKTTILLRQKKAVVPFDIHNFRIVEYNSFVKDKAIDKIAETVRESITLLDKTTDSPVYEIYPSLTVTVNDAGFEDRSLPWEMYWERISRMSSLLGEASADGRYNPDGLLGITNGGGAFVDFLSRKMNFPGPVVCLWANRRGDGADYMDNPINSGLIDGLKKTINKDPNDTRILIVDDLIASGSTSGMAVRFLRRVFPGWHLRYLPLFYRSMINKPEIDKILLWKHHAFNFDQEKIDELHLVRYSRFPYEKAL
jgi:adenine/guanine phosphoribosyltransferase-like PRPP-binding protein